MVRILVFLGLISLAFGGGWQDYVNHNLMEKGLRHAAILVHAGTLWVKSKGFSLRAGESKALVDLYEHPSNANGIIINGTKYRVIKKNNRSIYGMKGSDGVVLVKMRETIIVGLYNKPLQPGKAAQIVEKLGDYFIENGL